MLRRNQRGSIDYVLYGVAIISVVVFLFFLILTLMNPTEPVKTGTTLEREQEDSAMADVDIPNAWHTYTNDDNGYTFNYPQEWGLVEQSEEGDEDAVSYQYRFTSNELTVISQVHADAPAANHSDDFLSYTSFSRDGTSVTFCADLACTKSTNRQSDEVRLFTNKYLHQSAEISVVDGQDLRLIQIINTEYDKWPGVVVSSVLQEGINPAREIEELLEEAVTNSYVETENIRLFADYIP